MPRFLSRLLWIVLILVVVVVGGAAAAFYLTPSSMIAGRVADAVREQTGRDLKIGGDIERGLFPNLTVAVSDVSLSNAEWAGDDPMIEAKSARVEIRLLPLLTGGIEVETLALEAPIIRLARAESGATNWDFEDGGAGDGGTGAAGGRGDGGGVDLVIKDARVTDGRILFEDRAADAVYDIADLTLSAALPKRRGELTIDGSASIDGRPATIAARAGSLDALASGRPAQTKFDIATAGLKVTFDGEAAMGAGPLGSGVFELEFDGDAPETAWIRALLPPEYADVGKVVANGQFEATETTFAASIDGEAAFRSRAVTLSARAEGGKGWDSGGVLLSIALQSGSDGLFALNWTGDVALKAKADDLVRVTGALSFESAALRAFTEWAGGEPLEAPEGAFETLSIQSNVEIEEGRAELIDLAIQLDDASVAGGIKVGQTEDGRPKLTATLSTTPLDLRPFIPASSDDESGAPAPSGGKGWSTEPFDFGALQLVDADLRIETEGLITPVLRFTDAVLTGAIEDGVLKLAVAQMTLYGGAATASIELNSNETPQLKLDAAIAGVALRPLMNDAADMDWLDGTGAIKLDLAASGASMKDMMESLGGDAEIDFRDGAIIGYNLAALVRNITSLGTASAEEQRTDFASLTASFAIKDGVAVNDDLLMQGPLIRVSGRGQIDIGAQTINYRLEPKAVATLEGQGGDGDVKGLVVPLNIEGPWDSAYPVPDLEGAALSNIEGIIASPGELGGALTDALQDVEGGGLGEALGEGLGEGLGGGLLDGVLGGGARSQSDVAPSDAGAEQDADEGAENDPAAPEEDRPTGGLPGLPQIQFGN